MFPPLNSHYMSKSQIWNQKNTETLVEETGDKVEKCREKNEEKIGGSTVKFISKKLERNLERNCFTYIQTFINR